MTKKHFERLAEGISKLEVDEVTRLKVAQMVGEVCIADNPRFSYTRFIGACGVRNTAVQA